MQQPARRRQPCQIGNDLRVEEIAFGEQPLRRQVPVNSGQRGALV